LDDSDVKFEDFSVECDVQQSIRRQVSLGSRLLAQGLACDMQQRSLSCLGVYLGLKKGDEIHTGEYDVQQESRSQVSLGPMIGYEIP
jgi:hypothetical protein